MSLLCSNHSWFYSCLQNAQSWVECYREEHRNYDTCYSPSRIWHGGWVLVFFFFLFLAYFCVRCFFFSFFSLFPCTVLGSILSLVSFWYFLNFKHFVLDINILVLLINNIVIVSSVQQRDSVIRIYVPCDGLSCWLFTLMTEPCLRAFALALSSASNALAPDVYMSPSLIYFRFLL